MGLVTLKLGFTLQLDFGLELGCTLASLYIGLWASDGLQMGFSILRVSRFTSALCFTWLLYNWPLGFTLGFTLIEYLDFWDLGSYLDYGLHLGFWRYLDFCWTLGFSWTFTVLLTLTFRWNFNLSWAFGLQALLAFIRTSLYFGVWTSVGFLGFKFSMSFNAFHVGL